MNESEDKIAKGLRRGCRDAWSSLYDLYAQRVWRAAARLLGGNSQETADIVQEVFMAAAESASRFDLSVVRCGTGCRESSETRSRCGSAGMQPGYRPPDAGGTA